MLDTSFYYDPLELGVPAGCQRALFHAVSESGAVGCRAYGSGATVGRKTLDDLQKNFQT